MYKYNPKRITCSAFNIPFEGYMDSTFITIEKVSKSVIVHEGGTGEITAVLNCSQLYKATVTFVQGSPTNTALSKKVPNAKKDFFPTGTFTLKDLNGDSVCNCKTAFLEDISKQDWGKDVTARPWVFYLPDADLVTGGGTTV